MPRQSIPNSLFGRRLREARNRLSIAQDKLSVIIGMDESCSSARISRYETEIHEPPFAIAEKLSSALHVPVAYFYCDDDELADLLVSYANYDKSKKDQLLAFAKTLR